MISLEYNFVRIDGFGGRRVSDEQLKHVRDWFWIKSVLDEYGWFDQ